MRKRQCRGGPLATFCMTFLDVVNPTLHDDPMSGAEVMQPVPEVLAHAPPWLKGRQVIKLSRRGG